MPWSDRTIVVTGASRGLGRAMMAGFAADGHRVIGCTRSMEAVDELWAEFGDPHWFDQVDVADDSAVKAWAGHIIELYGPPDLLINNAALINKNNVLWQVPAEEFSAVVDVNIKGVVNVIRHFVPAMVQRKTGVIVNFSSAWGRSTSPEVAPYCATKFAVEGLTKAMAQELPRGMAAVALNPGVINTEMLQSCFGDAAGSYPTPADWASRAVPFILELGVKDNGKSVTVE